MPSGSPKVIASTGWGAEKLHDAVDGWLWFYPELPNGWDSARFTSAAVVRAGLRQAGDAWSGQIGVFRGRRELRVAAPHIGGSLARRTLADPGDGTPSPNGVLSLRWPAIRSERLRVTMAPSHSKAIGLIEVKAFSQ